MSPMRIIILLVAALAAAGAAFLVRNMAPEPAAPTQTAAPVEQAPVRITEVIEVPQTPVLVLTRDVRVGDLLSAGDFEWKEWPDTTLNMNYYTQDMFPNAIEDLTESVVRTAMVENEPVLPSKIVRKGETGYMAALLTPGMRAVSVEISVDNASGGFILPGDRVDVMITYDLVMGKDEAGDNIVRPTTTTIMENVRILAIDQVFGDGTGNQFAIGSTATVELYPDQARLLVLANRL
ncbi:MAG: Flp pilus assembly protein CpaB, partial [Hyphomonadaceae bacterium]|nr:Flp pilus assembly protein CpaB [Hyphomonadaceae bacterium]